MPDDHTVQDTSTSSTGDTPGDARPCIDAYVERLKQTGAIRSAAVERAFRRVPRHFLVQAFYTAQGDEYTKIDHDPFDPRPEHVEIIYADSPLVTRLKDGLPTSSSSQPGLVAEMIELLGLDSGMRVLEIGAGTGYNAALMAEIVGAQTLVTTVDNQPDVVTQTQDLLVRAGYGEIRVLYADGFYGAPTSAPYDRVIVTVGTPELSPHWVEQLNPSGRILLPLRHVGMNPLVLVSKRGDTILGKVVGRSGFMAIQGELHDDVYWGGPPSPPTERPIEQFPVWPDLFGGEAGGAWLKSRPWGFWFHLGIRDRRARLTN